MAGRMKKMMGCGAIFLLMLSCNKDEPLAVYWPGPDYFPLAVGQFFIYEVDSTAILFQEETTRHYEVRHTVTDSFKTEEGYYAFTITRSMRANEGSPWTAMPTWHARRTEREAILQEGNVPYVKLVFPLSANLVWNGNELNAMEGADNCGNDAIYKCDQYKLPENVMPYTTVTGLPFDETIFVEEGNDPDLIAVFDVRNSRYAKEVGLIEREITHLVYCSDREDCLGKQQVIQGLRYKAVLKEYGGH
jgi:hypothetical protein